MYQRANSNIYMKGFGCITKQDRPRNSRYSSDLAKNTKVAINI